MSFSPADRGALSPETEICMPSISMKLDNTFATMQEAKSNMKVFARVRPMLQREEDEGYKECVGVIDDQVVRAIVPASSVKFKNLSQNGQEIYEDFTYSQAFGPETGQFPFFRHTIMDVMQGFIEGQNCLVFSYGITNSGKTFTLQGDEANPGIIPLAMRLFFASIKHQLLEGISVKPDKFADILMLSDKESYCESQLKEQLLQLSEQETANKTNASSRQKSFASTLCDCFNDDFEFETETTLPPEEMQAAQSALLMKDLSKQSADQQEGLCSIWISFVEIYNEYVYDLLQPIIKNRPKLMFAEDQTGEVYVKGAREICISSSEEAIKLLDLGRRNLRIASTKLNYQSSRSHCIFTVKVVRLYDENNGRVNRISFCDLAGSERASKSKTTGVHLKEAGYINTSLLVLGKCLEQLRLNQGSRDKKMIPLRESKLTRLFSGHFLGRGKAVMIANASPCEHTFDETLNVLRFSALLKTVKLNDSYISTASCSLQNITNQWAKSKAQMSDVSFDQSSDFDNSMWNDMQEKDEMIEKLLDLADSLRNNLEKEKREKAQLEVTIRQDVCREYSEYSDELIENQKRIAAEYVDALTAIHEKKMENLEAKYERQIAELKAQLEEYDSCTDESSMSINKGNATLNNEDAETSKLLFESPMPIAKPEEKNQSYTVDSPVRMVPLKSEASNEDLLHKIEEKKSLQSELSLVTKELDATKGQLAEACEKLKEAQTEAASVTEECASLTQKLQNAEKISMECTQELDAFKAEILKKDQEIETLKKEKKYLEESILFSSEEMVVAAAEIEQLKKERIEAEEQFSQKMKQLQQRISDAKQEYEDLHVKFDKTSGDLIETNSKYEKLESECENLKNHNSKLLLDCKALEDKLAQLVKTHIDEAEIKCAELTKELEIVNKTIQEQKTEIAQLEEEKCTALSAELESNLTDMKCQDLSKQLEEVNKVIEDQRSKINKLEDDCSVLKSENAELLASYNIEKDRCTALTEEHDNATVQIKHLENELSEAMNADLKAINNLKLEKEIMEEKYNELLSKFEEQISKISKLEHDCAAYKMESEQHLQTIKQFEEIVASSEKLETAPKDRLSQFGLQMESTAQELKEQKKTNFMLEEKSADLSSQLEKSLKGLEERDVKINELITKSDELKSKVDELELECATHKNNHAGLFEDYTDLEEKFADMKEKFDNASVQIKALEKELTEAMNADLKMVDDLKLVKEVIEEKYNELLPKFEEQISKISKLEHDCAAHKRESEQHLQIIKQFEESVASNENSETATKDRLSEFTLQLESTAGELEEEKIKNNMLEEKSSDLASQLEKSLQSLEERDEKINELLTKSEELKSKVDELELECATHKNNHADLLEDYMSLEEKFGDMKEKFGTGENSSLKSKLDELQAERDVLRSSYDKVYANYQTLDTAFAALSKTIASLRTDHEQLKQEKLDEADAYAKSNEELLRKYENSTKEIEELRTRSNEAQTTITKYEEEVSQLRSEYAALNEKFCKVEAENVVLRGDESSKEEIHEQLCKLNEAQRKIKESEQEIVKLCEECVALREKCLKLEEENMALQVEKDLKNELEVKLSGANDKIERLESEIAELNEECIALKEKYTELKVENAALQEKEMEEQFFKLNEAQSKIKECEKEMSQLRAEATTLKTQFSELEAENKTLQATLEETQTKHLKATHKFTAKITEMEKTISTNKDNIKDLTETIEILEKYKSDNADYEVEVTSAKEQIVNLKNELQKAKLLQEQSDTLCQALEKCELSASNKVKLLQASALSSAELTADLKRQLKEKSHSIAELEKALCARQKQVKEMDVKMNELVAARKEDSALIEQLQHEKELLDAEISKIKMNLQQAKEKEGQKNAHEKPKKKRSLSDANKDTTEEIPVNQEKLNSKNSINEDKVNSKTKEQEDEREVLPKRRRVLRAKQPKVEVMDESFGDKSGDDDDYEPSKKTVNRKSKKKTVNKEAAPPKARTSRKKLQLQEQENMSPVKKAMQFVGSKIMSVAQSVNAMPSPRVTRGRKKLFNADAAPKKAEPKWKI